MKPEHPASRKTAQLFRELTERWRGLNTPLWHLAGDGAVIASCLPEAWQAFAGGETVADTLRQQFTQATGPTATTIECLPGLHLVIVPSPFGQQGGRIAAAFCSTAGPEQLTRHEPTAIAGLTKLLTSSITDLARNIKDTEALGQFTERLTQAYEESNLLFRMSRLLNLVSDPRVVLQGICGQMHQVLPFKWLALAFGDFAETEPSLRGHFILTGDVDQNEVRREALALMSESGEADTWTKILDVSSNPHAATLQTELLAEPITHDGKLVGILVAGGKGGPDPGVSSFEVQFLDAAADFLGVYHQNVSRLEEQRRMFIGTLRALTASIDAKDRYTCGHSERVGQLASQMAQAMGLDAETVERYRIAGMIHDVGKIGVPEAVLCKPGRLTDEEFAHIKRHPEIGYDILKDIPGMQDILPGVLHHHEHFAGGGYPHKLAGEQIPVIARVLTLCDTFDAMSSTRSYRKALTREYILAEIIKCAGRQFDPELAEKFVKLDFSEFDAMLVKAIPQAAIAA